MLPPDLVRAKLIEAADGYFRGLIWSTIVLFLGVIMEEWNPLQRLPTHTINTRTRVRVPRKRVIRSKKTYAKLAILFVVLGIAGEGTFEYLASRAETAIRSHDNVKLGEAIVQAGVASEKAAEADERAKASELALARYTAPTFSIPVRKGSATPDLSKGYNQRVVLTSDTRIKVPRFITLPNNFTVTWVLFLDQDEAGSHVYTIDFMPDLIALRGLLPNTRTTFEFVTEADGTTSMRGLPTINRPLFKPKHEKP